MVTHYGVSNFENSDWFSRCLTLTCILREDQYGGLNEATTVSLSSGNGEVQNNGFGLDFGPLNLTLTQINSETICIAMHKC